MERAANQSTQLHSIIPFNQLKKFNWFHFTIGFIDCWLKSKIKEYYNSTVVDQWIIDLGPIYNRAWWKFKLYTFLYLSFFNFILLIYGLVCEKGNLLTSMKIIRFYPNFDEITLI